MVRASTVVHCGPADAAITSARGLPQESVGMCGRSQRPRSSTSAIHGGTTISRVQATSPPVCSLGRRSAVSSGAICSARRSVATCSFPAGGGVSVVGTRDRLGFPDVGV
ncbi:hypothetical protein [Micromonospora trifolii]|uniref:hypothetical protein n=1 Tax=Micromonospora trifolii TaxID=2911208 RepID=UPI003CF41F37